jgi:hypothetical protein
MTSIPSRPTVEHAASAAEAVRVLTHLTLGRHALSEPAELDLLVEELAIMTGRLPQLLRQLHRWLDTEQHAGRLRSDDTTDPARIVTRATAELTDAGHAANDLNRALDTAHQHLSHLAATEPDRAHEPEPSHTRRSAVPSMRARAWRRPGRNGWPPVGTFVATSGQVSWPPVGRNRCPLTPRRGEPPFLAQGSDAGRNE